MDSKKEQLLNYVRENEGETAREIAAGRYGKDTSQRFVYYALQHLVRNGLLVKASRAKDSKDAYYRAGTKLAEKKLLRSKSKALPNCCPPTAMERVEREVAKALAAVTVFPSKRIVASIAERNKSWRNDLICDFNDKVDWDFYLYTGSACVFPGVRRKQGKKEQGVNRGKYYPEKRAILDENEMVRHTWTFLSIGVPFNGNRSWLNRD